MSFVIDVTVDTATFKSRRLSLHASISASPVSPNINRLVSCGPEKTVLSVFSCEDARYQLSWHQLTNQPMIGIHAPVCSLKHFGVSVLNSSAHFLALQEFMPIPRVIIPPGCILALATREQDYSKY